MTITQAQRRRLERLERLLALKTVDVSACPGPSLSPEQLRVVIGMLTACGGMEASQFAAIRRALWDDGCAAAVTAAEQEAQEAQEAASG